MTSSTSSTPSTDRILAGVALMLGFCVTAPLLDVAAKLASSSVPVGQITAARFIVQCALMAPFIWIMGLSLRVARAHWLALLLRLSRARLNDVMLLEHGWRAAMVTLIFETLGRGLPYLYLQYLFAIEIFMWLFFVGNF